MKNRNYCDKELDLLQKLKKENRELKRSVQALRRQISRLDVDRYQNLKELVDKHHKEEDKIVQTELLESLKNEWACHENCGGYLEIILYNKLTDTWYFRRCNACGKRTKSKRFTEEVKGIRK